MSKSLIQTVNPSSQDVTAGGIISLGSVSRRFGCNCRLNGNAIEVEGNGYYTIDGTVTLSPAEVGDVSLAIYDNGVVIPGSTVTGSVGAVGDVVTLPIVATIRQGCCDGVDSLTVVPLTNASTVTGISIRVEKV